MSIQRVNPVDIESFTLQLNPSRTYSSSSTEGVTGSVALFARSSHIEKEVQPSSMFLDDSFNDHSLISLLDSAKESNGTNITAQMSQYMLGVNSQLRSARKQQTVGIVRFEPSVRFTQDTQRKNVIKNVLYPFYRNTQPTAHWAYTNYNTLNFFTASSVPSNTALLYPNVVTSGDGTYVSGTYNLSNAFTFEFFINPRYTVDNHNDSFKAGTLFHLSSSYAVSIMTGSSKDSQSKPDGYRILLQISGAADVTPSHAVPGSLTFLSDDNSLRKNNWHHVAIRWCSTVNDHTGTFIVDGNDAGKFVIPHDSIMPRVFLTSNSPDVLCIGNFYEGSNSSTNAQSLFFNQNTSRREGLVQLIDDGDATTNTPAAFTFNHPLNAEVHELKIHNTYLSIESIQTSMTTGPTSTGSMLLYVPPFFTKESPVRTPYGTDGNGWTVGGILQTPFFSVAGSTVDPFNVAMSFGIDGKLMNLENFTRDFVTRNYPRLLHLSASEIGATVDTALSANAILYDEQTNYYSGSIRKRNVTVLPNDNGLFTPNYSLLLSGSFVLNPKSGSNHDRYTNDLGNLDLSIISLSDMIPSASSFDLLNSTQSGTMYDDIAGASPESIGVDPGEVLTIFQRTLDGSSNVVTFFDISNLYYGQRIMPESFYVTDTSITGTAGKVSITLRDNGQGSLYRADALTKHATWNNVGDIFYNEGLVVIKNPALAFFGADQHKLSFKGEQNIHTMRVNVLARPGEINSSSNPSYQEISASLLAHETDARFVYISGLNFHDDNLNVIMKTKLAQPVIKRISDRYAFRIKMDF